MKTFTTSGTCARAINYEVENGVVTQCTFAGGCPGNTQGVAKLVIGRKVEELIPLLRGEGSSMYCVKGESEKTLLGRGL